jgi:ribosome-associated protein
LSTKTLKAPAKGKNKLAKLEDVIIDAILDKKGEEVISLDLRKVGDAVADVFIICHATSRTQVKAIADNIDRKVKALTGEIPWHSEGVGNLEWVLLDYVNVVAHVFMKDKREFYRLEELWQDAERTDYE